MVGNDEENASRWSLSYVTQEALAGIIVALLMACIVGGLGLWRSNSLLANDVSDLEEDIRTLQAWMSDREDILYAHTSLQEHEGADRRLDEHNRRLYEIEHGAVKEIRDHVRGTGSRINRLGQLERRMEIIEVWKEKGGRFTAKQGEEHSDRINNLERKAHTHYRDNL